jgi:high-affinity Fe2+/Pb2+ permease
MVRFYPGELWKRVLEAWPVVAVILGVLGAFAVAWPVAWFLEEDSTSVFRYAGFGLELLGLSLVVYGLDAIPFNGA